MSTKALSYEEHADRVRRAIDRAIDRSSDDVASSYVYVEFVYEGYAIVCEYESGTYYCVSYSESADGITV